MCTHTHTHTQYIEIKTTIYPFPSLNFDHFPGNIFIVSIYGHKHKHALAAVHVQSLGNAIGSSRRVWVQASDLDHFTSTIEPVIS